MLLMMIWWLYTIRDIDSLKLVQRRFTKRLFGLKNVSYYERLQHLNAPTLELRRLRTNLFWCNMIVFGLVGIKVHDFLKLALIEILADTKYFMPTCNFFSVNMSIFRLHFLMMLLILILYINLSRPIASSMLICDITLDCAIDYLFLGVLPRGAAILARYRES